MNIIEAVQSRKRFKRKSWPQYAEVSSIDAGLGFNSEDILADDWMVQERSILVEVRCCRECPNRIVRTTSYCYKHNGEIIKNKDQIPDWCPFLEENE